MDFRPDRSRARLNLTTYFLDSSAAVKLYLSEPGTLWLKTIAEAVPANEFHIVRITAVEVAAAFFRRVRGQSLPAGTAQRALVQLRHHLSMVFRIIELTPSLMDAALVVAERQALRGYDCVQLAAALGIHRVRLASNLDGLVLLAADRELLTAARAEGLQVEDPNEHRG